MSSASGVQRTVRRHTVKPNWAGARRTSPYLEMGWSGRIAPREPRGAHFVGIDPLGARRVIEIDNITGRADGADGQIADLWEVELKSHLHDPSLRGMWCSTNSRHGPSSPRRTESV